MKYITRFLSWMLTLLCVLLLCACNGSENPKDDADEENKLSKAEKAILGSWCAGFDGELKFRENGIGSLNGTRFTWKYDNDIQQYVLSIQTEAELLKVKTDISGTEEPAMSFIVIDGVRYFRKDDLPKDLILIDMQLYGVDDDATHTGSTLFFCEPVKDATKLKTGDVITFWTVNNGRRVLSTKPITAIYDAGGYYLFETGNAQQTDPLTVHESEIIGKIVESVKE